MTIDTNKLQQNLDKKDFNAVKVMIDGVMSEKLTDKDRGSAWVDFAEVYLDVMNSLNARYESVLREAVKSLEMINKAESKINDKIRISELKSSLKK